MMILCFKKNTIPTKMFKTLRIKNISFSVGNFTSTHETDTKNTHIQNNNLWILVFSRVATLSAVESVAATI